MRLIPACLILILLSGVNVILAQEQDPVPLVSEGEYDIINFLLLGSDTSNANNVGRTDSIMVVSVNRTAGTVSLLSIPRDLYVYIPDVGMNKINTAYAYGENNSEVGGAELLKATIRHNLGIEIDHFARVDFNDFKRIINDLGGVEVAVDCAIQDWRLIEPDLDPMLEESWEMFTLPVGVHQMDGELALWYSRSRRTSSDFDRGRRQQVIMRAIWQRIRGLNLFDQITDIWPQLLENVTTDIQVNEMIELAPLAATIDTSHISSYVFRANSEVTFSTSPEGASILVPVPSAINELIHHLYQPPTQSELMQENARVEVVNASSFRGFGRIAVERLSWEGFVPTLSGDAPSYREYTLIYDYTGQTKGGSLGLLQSVLRVSNENVIVEPRTNREVDFRVEIGGSYFACTHNVVLPSPIVNTEGG